MRPGGGPLQDYARDIIIALLIGIGTGIGLGMILFLLGVLAGGTVKGLSLSRSGLMIAGALVLITGAVQFLKGGHLPADTFHLPRLRRDTSPEPEGTGEEPKKALPVFRVLSRRVSLAAIGAGILLISAIPDYILIRLR